MSKGNPETEDQRRKRIEERMLNLRKDLVLLLHERNKQDPSLKKEAAQDGKKAEDKSPHVDAESLLRGNLVKGQAWYTFIFDKKSVSGPGTEYYAWNAWNYLGTRPRGDVRDIYRAHSVDWYHFYEAARKPNFYQAFPLSALGGYDKKRIYGTVKGEPASTESGYYQLKQIVERLEPYVSKCDPADRPEATARLSYAKKVRNLLGKRDGQDKLLAAGQTLARETLKVGCMLPYEWQAHHILPMNCFYEHLKGWHIRVIATSDYDINQGSNIIFLPECEQDIHWHKLPQHLGSHPKYDKRLERDFKKLMELMQEKSKGPHEGITKAAETELLDMETRNFKYITSLYTQGRMKLN